MRHLRRAVPILRLLAMLLAVAPPQAQAHDDAGYLRFADRMTTQLAPTWSPAKGYYESGSPSLDSRVNAAMLVVHATAARAGHSGAARDDARARRLAEVLTGSPPYFTAATAPAPDPMFHTPGWVGNLVPGHSVMDKAIDPKVAEGLAAAWQARDAIGLPQATTDAIVSEIDSVAHGPFFRFPNVRLNQINWPLELAAYHAQVTGRGELLRDEYGLQLGRFLAEADRNLSPSYRFRYLPHRPPFVKTNLDSAEYANITLHFLAFYDDARRAGMPALPPEQVRLLRAWVRRALLGYWTHSGLLNWDTGLGLKRWMKGKTWAYAQQGLLAMATTARFQGDPRGRAWAKAMFDAGLDAYARMSDAHRLAESNLFGTRQPVRSDNVLLAARMAANAARAVSAGLGGAPSEKPPPFFAFDADVGRLAVSTPAYSTAVVAVNRRAFPYGGVELARLLDGRGRPLTGIGGTSLGAFGVVVRDRAGQELLASQYGRRLDPPDPPIVVRRPRGTAGPFDVLDASGRRRSAEFAITTRHRFTARRIEESWRIRRRAGKRFARVVVQLPSWGAGASHVAVRDDGVATPVRVGSRPVPLRGLREIRVRVPDASFAIRLRRVPERAMLQAVQPVPEATNPDPGPTLALTLAAGPRFERVRLDAVIVF